MNGDTELLWPNIMSIPTIKSIIIIGAIHHAFRTFKKSHNSKIRGLLFLFFPNFTPAFSITSVVIKIIIKTIRKKLSLPSEENYSSKHCYQSKTQCHKAEFRYCACQYIEIVLK